MPPTPRPLTIIVATTPIPTPTTTTESSSNTPIRLGIGHSGTLPWPRIKTDMSFFARVTSRPPAPGTINAIIMGRKTYDSVPAHLRPLAKRISTIITRDVEGLKPRVAREVEDRKAKLAASAAAAAAASASGGNGNAAQQQQQPATDAIVCGGLDEALQELETRYGEGKLGKVFVIGGAEIYGAVLAKGAGGLGGGPVRIVMTNVEKKGYAEGDQGEVFECDTFFPVDEELFGEKEGWRRVTPEEVTEWVGEEVTGRWIEEGMLGCRWWGMNVNSMCTIED
ncbi:dihydrofolate reductase [Aspergillus eucalypticola CBS 122712]|uniref:Dihydrofolate reductase n=1 Tax=Aspergillus eucalypticola (strain CBS 122712 / IBT 29274) TaxID=1448314 RepID=A0A317VPN3_ASPEC|nr:dihydrofolate reductase [Aspergillus eucalypticola CBS 122712]PWY75569.1 dihydrofolate reductase [Aspergillus eucalypticola CBS 122712]